MDQVSPPDDPSSFGDRFNELRRHDKYSDCSFKVDGGTLINCHKLILTASSPVFEAMFYGPLAETHAIRVDDIDGVTFAQMLDFIYSGRLPAAPTASVHCLLDLLYCAQKYLIDELAKQCLVAIEARKSVENVLELLAVAAEMRLDSVTLSCLASLRAWMREGRNFANALLGSEAALSPECLHLVVQEVFAWADFDAIACFVRAWCLIECAHRGVEATQNNFRTSLIDCHLPADVIEALAARNYAETNAKSRDLSLFQRVYYKASTPLIVGEELETASHFWSDTFMTIGGFQFNSRLWNPQQSLLDSGYVEELELELWAGDERLLIQHVQVPDVAYNATFQCHLECRDIVIFPGLVYSVKVRWNEDQAGAEYPRSVFSNYAKHKKACLHFCESRSLFLEGSILNAVICDASE